MATDRMPARRRLAAWVVTGPIGHFYGTIADIVTALAKHWWTRARDRPRHQ